MVCQWFCLRNIMDVKPTVAAATPQLIPAPPPSLSQRSAYRSLIFFFHGAVRDAPPGPRPRHLLARVLAFPFYASSTPAFSGLYPCSRHPARPTPICPAMSSNPSILLSLVASRRAAPPQPHPSQCPMKPLPFFAFSSLNRSRCPAPIIMCRVKT